MHANARSERLRQRTYRFAGKFIGFVGYAGLVTFATVAIVSGATWVVLDLSPVNLPPVDRGVECIGSCAECCR